MKPAPWSYIVALTFWLAASGFAQTSSNSFPQAVADYQRTPSYEAAQRVITLAATTDPLPPVTEEARRHFVRGVALFKEARSADDYPQVLAEFKQATQLAPWWPEARYNLAVAHEAAGQYAEAIAELKLYRLFKLPEREARTVQDKIYTLEARSEKLAATRSAETRQRQDEAEQRRADEQLAAKLEGKWRKLGEENESGWIYQVRATGNAIESTQVGYYLAERRELSGPALNPSSWRGTIFQSKIKGEYLEDNRQMDTREILTCPMTGIVDEGGNRIELTIEVTGAGGSKLARTFVVVRWNR